MRNKSRSLLALAVCIALVCAMACPVAAEVRSYFGESAQGFLKDYYNWLRTGNPPMYLTSSPAGTGTYEGLFSVKQYCRNLAYHTTVAGRETDLPYDIRLEMLSYSEEWPVITELKLTTCDEYGGEYISGKQWDIFCEAMLDLIGAVEYGSDFTGDFQVLRETVNELLTGAEETGIGGCFDPMGLYALSLRVSHLKSGKFSAAFSVVAA